MEHLDLLNNDLQVSSTSQKFLTEAARWGKFLSVIGFIFCVLLAVASFFAPIRCIPLDNPKEEGKDIFTGKPSSQRVLFARAY